MDTRSIAIGDTVRIKFPSGPAVSFTIAPSLHTDPGHGVISCDSPLGKALLGKKAGDRVTYAVENRMFQADITEIKSSQA